MFRSLGWPEIALILVIILVVFGVGKLPQVGSAIGKGIRAFKKAQQGEDDDESVKVAADKKATEKKA
jgi:sec-independent protein translocase protein TatA